MFLAVAFAAIALLGPGSFTISSFFAGLNNKKQTLPASYFDQCGSAVRHFVTSSMHSTASSAVIR